MAQQKFTEASAALLAGFEAANKECFFYKHAYYESELENQQLKEELRLLQKKNKQVKYRQRQLECQQRRIKEELMLLQQKNEQLENENAKLQALSHANQYKFEEITIDEYELLCLQFDQYQKKQEEDDIEFQEETEIEEDDIGMQENEVLCYEQQQV
jgi:hypothetical protein